jgi:lipocalin-like protein
MRLVLAALLISLSTSAFANDAELRQKIVGTWTLVSVVYEDQATKELSPVLGEKPRGRQIATADGRWLALVTAENRPVPKTDEERARALTSMIAYTGRYPCRRRQGHHQGGSRLERSLGWRRADALHPLRGRPAVHREHGDAAPQRQQQGGEGDRDLGPGEVGETRFCSFYCCRPMPLRCRPREGWDL